MNILIVSDDLFPGGAAQNVVDISNELHRRGHSVTIAAGYGEYRSRLDPGIQCITLPTYSYARKKRFAGLFVAYRELRNLIRRNSYDIVHTHKRITSALVKSIRLPAGTRHITHFHNTFSDKRNFTFFGDFSICCSDAVRNTMIQRFGCDPDKVVTIHYGIHGFREFSNEENGSVFDLLDIPRTKKVIASIGLFAPYKDRRNLIRAIVRIAGLLTERNIAVVIQGYGEEEKEIRRMIIDNRLTDLIKIVRHDFSAEAIMNISEFMILNSRDSEGFPFVILEGASIGKIHIGTNVGGISEFISNGNTGLLIPPEDPDTLSAAIIKLLDDPQSYRRMGENAGHAFRSQYTLTKYIDAIEDTYRTVLKNGAR